jgi:tetratricopeptide (TPR) repeat protein
MEHLAIGVAAVLFLAASCVYFFARLRVREDKAIADLACSGDAKGSIELARRTIERPTLIGRIAERIILPGGRLNALARALADAGFTDEALEIYGQIQGCTRTSGRPFVLLNTAEALLTGLRLDETEPKVRQAIAEANQIGGSRKIVALHGRWYLALLHIYRGQFELALDLFRDAPKSDFFSLHVKSLVAYLKGDFRRATEISIQSCPSSRSAWGTELEAATRPVPEAREAFDSMVQRMDDNSRSTLWRVGALAAATGELKDAAEAFELDGPWKLPIQASSRLEAASIRPLLLDLYGRNLEAEQALQEVARWEGVVPRVLPVMAESARLQSLFWRRRGLPDRSKPHSERAMSLSRTPLDLQLAEHELGCVHFALGSIELARASFQRCVNCDIASYAQLDAAGRLASMPK